MDLEIAEVITKRRKREDPSFVFEGYDLMDYDRVIDNWLSEELSLMPDLPLGLSEQEVTTSHYESSTNSKKKRRFSSHINNISKDPTKIRLPPILKSDIRKKYPIMFINMMNMCDIDLVELFFEKYTNPPSTVSTKCIDFGLKEVKTKTHKFYDLKQEKIDKIKNEDDTIPQNISFDCLNDVINFIILMINLSPDRYIQMKRSEIITRSDSFKTEINVYFHVHGTRISHWTPIEVGKFLFSLKDRHVMSRQELVEEFQSSMPRMKTFVPLHVEGKFTLNIDNSREDLRISNITSDAVLLSH